MNETAAIDFKKSLAELSGVDWGPPPVNGGSLMQQRHILRRRPLVEWSHGELIAFLGIGTDHELLIPLLMERLRADPEASDGTGSSGLLRTMLSLRDYWRRAPLSEIEEIRELAKSALGGIFEITDDWDRLKEERDLYCSLWEFEVFLSRLAKKDSRST